MGDRQTERPSLEGCQEIAMKGDVEARASGLQ